MSSILNALEKSERERNQGSVPQYQDMSPPEESRSHWKWLLFVFIVCVLLAFAAVKWILPTLNWQSSAAVINEKTANEKNEILDYLRLTDLEKSGIPEQRINVVSVSADRERSFVMLGEKMYREGDGITDTVSLEAIKKDHIVFNKQGVLIRRNLE